MFLTALAVKEEILNDRKKISKRWFNFKKRRVWNSLKKKPFLGMFLKKTKFEQYCNY